MTTIQVLYDAKSNTFIAKDEHENSITFKANRELEESATNSSGKSVGPMLSLLMACGACSGIDIVMLLEKQRQTFEHLTIEIKGERETNVTPALWKEVEIIYHIEGNADSEKVKKAADLSVTKYCSVLETLRRAGANVTYQVVLNQEKIK